MGEGWGEGEYSVISRTYVTLPLIPSHQGRGNLTFYESINLGSKIEIEVEISWIFVLNLLQVQKAISYPSLKEECYALVRDP